MSRMMLPVAGSYAMHVNESENTSRAFEFHVMLDAEAHAPNAGTMGEAAKSVMRHWPEATLCSLPDENTNADALAHDWSPKPPPPVEYTHVTLYAPVTTSGIDSWNGRF